MNTARTIYRDLVEDPNTEEYLTLTFKSDPPAPGEQPADLDMVVRFSFDRATYYDAAWFGTQWTEGTSVKRRAHLLMNEDNLPAGENSTIFARLTDNPELPILKAGTLYIR